VTLYSTRALCARADKSEGQISRRYTELRAPADRTITKLDSLAPREARAPRAISPRITYDPGEANFAISSDAAASVPTFARQVPRSNKPATRLHVRQLSARNARARVCAGEAAGYHGYAVGGAIMRFFRYMLGETRRLGHEAGWDGARRWLEKDRRHQTSEKMRSSGWGGREIDGSRSKSSPCLGDSRERADVTSRCGMPLPTVFSSPAPLVCSLFLLSRTRRHLSRSTPVDRRIKEDALR